MFGGLIVEQAAWLDYAAKSERSWKSDALNTTEDRDMPGTKFPHSVPHNNAE
jgi:hypothetical protein